MSEHQSRERAEALIRPYISRHTSAYIREAMVGSIAAALRNAERETIAACTKVYRELQEMRDDR